MTCNQPRKRVTAIEVVAKALGDTYTARGDAVAVIEELKTAGYLITYQGTPDEPYEYPDDAALSACEDSP